MGSPHWDSSKLWLSSLFYLWISIWLSPWSSTQRSKVKKRWKKSHTIAPGPTSRLQIVLWMVILNTLIRPLGAMMKSVGCPLGGVLAVAVPNWPTSHHYNQLFSQSHGKGTSLLENHPYRMEACTMFHLNVSEHHLKMAVPPPCLGHLWVKKNSASILGPRPERPGILMHNEPHPWRRLDTLITLI